MNKINKDTLGFLGLEFQYRLVLQILTDRKFGGVIIQLIDPNYFEESYLRIIVATIKDAYEKYENIPDLGSLKTRLVENAKDEIERGFIVSQLKRVEEAELNDTYYIQETAIKFCKRQELKKALRVMDEIIKNGSIDDYDKCEEILKKALDFGEQNDDGIDVLENIENVLSDDFRLPIRTGISGLDDVMGGGLAKGELAIILAAWGVGKTTMMTKLCNTGKIDGYNVLQIFFEDSPKVIQRKHISCATGIALNDLNDDKELTKELLKPFDEAPGILKLKKFPSSDTTVPKIRQYIRKLISSGFKPDLVIIDYIDCIQPSKRFDDVNVGEGAVMREVETLCDELEFACWVATQGNRCVQVDELVNIKNQGDIRIGDVKIGDEIMTHDGYKNVSHVFPIEKQKVYEIKTKSGKSIRVSGKHKFPTNDGVFKSINSGLSVGDKLLTKK